jgi:hypothetical protein
MVAELQGKGATLRPRNRREENIKMDLRDRLMGYEDVDRI